MFTADAAHKPIPAMPLVAFRQLRRGKASATHAGSSRSFSAAPPEVPTLPLDSNFD